MNLRRLARLAFAIPSLAVTVNAATPVPSKISAFFGTHNGTLLLYPVSGTTTGKFTGSKEKEVGALSLLTVVASSGTLISVPENFSFNKNTVRWSLALGTTSVSGVGRTKISKNTITYTIPVSSVSGVTPISGMVTGTMRLAKNNHLSIRETITSGLPFFYTLGGKKPKK